VSDKVDSWEDVFRTACKAYQPSLYALCKQAGVDQGQLSRFMAGQQSLGLATAEKLARVLGITLQTAPKQRRKKA
jgi:transcriptional regulator with XRE-family HTH domain